MKTSACYGTSLCGVIREKCRSRQDVRIMLKLYNVVSTEGDEHACVGWGPGLKMQHCDKWCQWNVRNVLNGVLGMSAAVQKAVSSHA